MTNGQVIKNAGFKTEKIYMDTTGAFGGKSNHVIALLNSNNETLCYEGKPYYPVGRIKAYASLIKTGSIDAECFSFIKQ